MEVARDSGLAELLREVRRIEVQSRRLASGVMAGAWRSVFRGGGIEFDEVREYAAGDDPRTIDWNVTARTGRPFVKKFVDERELSILFLLDLSASMGGGFGVLSARALAARVCACLALSAVRSHDKVGLIAFAGRVERFVPPEHGLPHALRVVRDCLALPLPAERGDPERALDLAARALRRHAVVFLISDWIGCEPGPALLRCARRHDLIAVRLLLPELSGLGGGLVRLRDPETGAERVIDAGDARVRAAFAAQVARWSGRVEAALRRAGADRMDVVVPRVPGRDSVVRPILEFFRMRELKGAKR